MVLHQNQFRATLQYCWYTLKEILSLDPCNLGNSTSRSPSEYQSYKQACTPLIMAAMTHSLRLNGIAMYTQAIALTSSSIHSDAIYVVGTFEVR